MILLFVQRNRRSSTYVRQEGAQISRLRIAREIEIRDGRTIYVVTTNPLQHHHHQQHHHQHHHHPSLGRPNDSKHPTRPSISAFRREQPPQPTPPQPTLGTFVYSFFYPLSSREHPFSRSPLPNHWVEFSQRRNGVRGPVLSAVLLFSFVYTWERRHASSAFLLSKSIFFDANSRQESVPIRKKGWRVRGWGVEQCYRFGT